MNTGQNADDPLGITNSAWEQTLFAHYESLDKMTREGLDDYADEPVHEDHPALKDNLIRAAWKYCEDTEDMLLTKTHPNGTMHEDAYFRWNEGIELRPQAVVGLIIQFLRDQGHLK